MSFIGDQINGFQVFHNLFHSALLTLISSRTHTRTQFPPVCTHTHMIISVPVILDVYDLRGGDDGG